MLAVVGFNPSINFANNCSNAPLKALLCPTVQFVSGMMLKEIGPIIITGAALFTAVTALPLLKIVEELMFLWFVV